MQKPALLVFMVAISFIIFGCHSTSQIVHSDFQGISGTWKAENGVWEVTISKKGEVLSAIHPLGEVLIKPNATVMVEMKDGNMSSYQGGDFTLNYNPENKELEINLKLEKIHVKFMENEISGTSDVTILGFISDDYTRWNADVIEVNDYGPRFPQAGIGPQPTVFNKQQ